MKRLPVLLVPVTVFLALLISACPGSASTWYVRANAPAGGDGLLWDTAFQTITAAITAASDGDEIWVARSTYNETVAMKTGVSIYGGFEGNEIALADRDWKHNPTVIDGNGAANYCVSAISVGSGRFDGFVLRRANMVGVNCSSSTVTIANCLITRNGIGIPNGGVNIYKSNPTIENCIITGNRSGGLAAGITCNSGAPTGFPIIRGCLIACNQGTGIACTSGSAATIANSIIAYNWGNNAGGLACNSSSPTLTNCTIYGNTAVYSTSGGGAVNALNYSVPVLTNCILGANSCDVGGCAYKDTTSLPQFRNCDFWSNGDQPFYPEVWNPVGSDGNISSDPLLMDPADADFRLGEGSGCIDAGDGTVPDLPDVDFYGEARVYPAGGTVDIGADEYNPPVEAHQPRVAYVAADAATPGDGTSWATAYAGVQDAILSAAWDGGEVWVKAGTYTENVELSSFVSLYGGFAGTEATRAERQSADLTVLDGGGVSAVVSLSDRSSVEAVVATNGGGAGIIFDGADASAVNCIVTDNSGYYGGGVILTDMSSVKPFSNCKVINCTIDGNSARDGAGVYVYARASLLVQNCIISNNQASNAGGAIFTYDTQSVDVTNSDFWANGENAFYPTTWHPVGSNGNISADPLFAAAGSDYRLTADSSCIGAGLATAAPENDIEGNSRSADGAFDIGAYEYVPTEVPILDLALAKLELDGTLIQVPDALVTRIFDGYIYVQEEDRSSGIRVIPSIAVATGDKVAFSGTLSTDSTDGERLITAGQMSILESAVQTSPLGMRVQNLGGGDFFYSPGPPASGQCGVWQGSGLNNIGLLVRLTGKIVWDGIDYFLDDGSGVQAKLVLSGTAAIPEGAVYVTITGISGCTNNQGIIDRVLRVNSDTDIVGHL